MLYEVITRDGRCHWRYDCDRDGRRHGRYDYDRDGRRHGRHRGDRRRDRDGRDDSHRCTQSHGRPARRRIRICLAEAPFDWQAPDLAQAWQRALARREDDYYHCVQRQVLAPKRRALLLFGAFHLRRRGETTPQLAHHILDPLGSYNFV